MNVIFVPSDRLINTPAINSHGSSFTVNTQCETLDYTVGLHEFGNLWDDIDEQRSSYSTISSFSSYDLKSKFWDRFEFINLLKETCAYDVYIKTTHGSLQLHYVSGEDRISVENKIRNRAFLTYLEFNSDLKPAILVWLKNNAIYEYRITSGVGHTLAGIKLFLRDKHFETLARIKFTNTAPEDHVEHEPYDDVPF